MTPRAKSIGMGGPALLALIGSLAACGCALDRADPAPGWSGPAAERPMLAASRQERAAAEPAPPAPEGVLEILGERLGGELGTLDPFDAVPSLARGTESDDFTEVTLLAEVPDGAAMTVLRLRGGTLDDVPRGTPTVWEAGGSSSSDLQLTVLGCAGARAGSWTFDQTADEVEVQVDEPDESGQPRLRFTATYHRPDRDRSVEGSLRYLR